MSATPRRPLQPFAAIRVRPQPEQSRSLLDAVHRQPAVQGQAAPVRRRQGHALHHPSTAARCSTAPPASGACNAGHGRKKIVRGGRATRSRRWITRPPSRWAIPSAFELASRLDHAAAGRSRPCVLHQLRLRGGRHRAEDRARLSPRARPGHAHAPDRARARLSRRRLRRHLGRRHRHQPQVLRPAADRRRSPAAHP